jgi:N6-L-threonylcarbamoyladenine synthase
MNILGLESSCDETAAAVVSDGRQVLSSVVASQVETHERYGGVVPELASREHLRAIVPVVDQALAQANVPIDAVAVTQGPGLVGSLLVGITFAKAFAMARGIPLIPVNHLEGHIHAVLLEHPQTELPALALIVSGGHTHFYRCESNFRYELLSRTRDDAAGEAYDKVAKLLGYAYPGGPILDQLAPFGNPKAVKFTRAKMSGNSLDLSFSGIKTAVLRWTEARDMQAEVAARRALVRPTLAELRAATPLPTLDLIASFQATIIDELLSRVRVFAEDLDLTNVIISGGVACNAGLRAAARRLPYDISFPTPKLSTDNAAMIAAAAYPRFLAGHTAGPDLRPKANFSLA